MVKATSKVTSKLQVTVPKVIADEAGIKPGDELEWRSAGRTVMVASVSVPTLAVDERLAILKAQDERVTKRWEGVGIPSAPPKRDWIREDLYGDRGLPRHRR